MAEGVDLDTEYTLMIDPGTGEYIQNPRGQYLVLSTLDKQSFFRDLVFTEAAESDPIPPESKKGPPEHVGSDDSNAEVANLVPQAAPAPRRPWSDKQTLSLINYYKANQKLFDDTVIRNEMLWRKFVKDHSKEGGYHDIQQVKDKWMRLKRQFHKMLDNRSAKATGARRIDWQYFDAMYEILKENPKSKSVAIASSRRGAANIVVDPNMPDNNFEAKAAEDKIEPDDPEYNTHLRKSKKTKLQLHLEALGVERQKSEDGVKERHSDTMKM
ncbi:uncharacterized protein LOC107042518 [Diachasma alloeum]|uniref:uncharacterized protein LOC107042518 n=1 Tax=Diachasma alloeum TaxID=454923 RepID=UPI00073844DB|nr:uncharacterized protein LOC107042518 [Diachasma alloeum]